MQLNKIWAVVAFLAVSSTAAPVSPAVEGRQVTEFRGAQYSRLYKEAKDEGLAERVPPEFSGAQYSRLYKEVQDEGLAKRVPPEFSGAQYAHLYKEVQDEGLVTRAE